MRWCLWKRLKEKQRTWHRWFAWYPVRLMDTGEYAWFETVWRVADYDGSDPFWSYELDIGENRALPLGRRVPSEDELRFRAKTLKIPVLHMDLTSNNWYEIRPDGSKVPVKITYPDEPAQK